MYMSFALAMSSIVEPLGPVHLVPSISTFICSTSNLPLNKVFRILLGHDRFGRAARQAHLAPDAGLRVDHVRLLLLARYRVRRADFNARPAAGAGLRVDAERYQRRALVGGALVVEDMVLVLVLEVAKGRENRVGGGAPQRAEAGGHDVGGERLQPIDCLRLSLIHI